MSRTRRQFRAGIELMEEKALLTAAPVISQATVATVLKEIDQAAGTYAKTQNADQFLTELSRISDQAPNGQEQLLPTWQEKGSGVQMVEQVKTDLMNYLSSSNVTFVPTVSRDTIDSVVKQIDRAAGTYAKTQDSDLFLAALEKISYEIPYGHTDLFPTWQTDTDIYDSTVKDSGLQMIEQLKTDLKENLTSAAENGTIRIV